MYTYHSMYIYIYIYIHMCILTKVNDLFLAYTSAVFAMLGPRAEVAELPSESTTSDLKFPSARVGSPQPQEKVPRLVGVQHLYKCNL